MGSVKYLIKGRENPSSIYVRFYHGREIDFIKSTTLLIDPKFWNNKKGEVRQIAEFSDKKNLQNKLNELKTSLLNSFNEAYSQGEIINSAWFNTRIKSHFDQDYSKDFAFFLDYSEFFFDSLPERVQRSGSVGVAKNTLKRYRTVINKLIEFEAYRNKRLKIGDIDLVFYNDFKQFLNKVQKLNFNTTGRYLSYVKTICLEARRAGLSVSVDIERQEFRQTREDTRFITLSEEEIRLIFEYDFSHTPYLDNARDWLIIGLWTGARVSDLLRFDRSNLSGEYLELSIIEKKTLTNYLTSFNQKNTPLK